MSYLHWISTFYQFLSGNTARIFSPWLLQWVTLHWLTRKLLKKTQHICLPIRPCQVWHTVAPHHVQKWKTKIWLMDWYWRAHRTVSMTSDLNLIMHQRKHTPFLHLWLNVGQNWRWQSWECVSGQICPTWERRGYKWLRGCGEITPWKKDQDWTSLVFYRLRKRIRKSVAVGWRDNLSCFKSLHSWSNDCNHSLAARGRRRGIQSKHTDTLIELS